MLFARLSSCSKHHYNMEIDRCPITQTNDSVQKIDKPLASCHCLSQGEGSIEESSREYGHVKEAHIQLLIYTLESLISAVKSASL